MTKHGWNDAMDALTDLRNSYLTIEGQRYLAEFTRMLAEVGGWDSEEKAIYRDGNLDKQATALVQGGYVGLAQCEPMWVSEDVVAILNGTAPLFKFEPLLPEDLMTPHGFAYFEQPMEIGEDQVSRDRGLPLPLRALQWNTINFDKETWPPNAPTRESPGWYPGEVGSQGVLLSFYIDDRDDNQAVRLGPSHLTLMHPCVVSFGSTYDEQNNFVVATLITYVKVFFRLAQQRIILAGKQQLARPSWKRAARWRDIREMVVITLRRPREKTYEGEERDVEWTHRWLVQAHWRNQWYPSEKVHRQILIAPYVKGPDDKPIIFKRRAFEFTR